MPVASPPLAFGIAESGGGDPFPLSAVRDAAVVLAPCHLVGVSLQQMTADPMMNSELGTPETGEIGLGLVGAAAFLALELDRVVNPLHRVRGIENVPPGSFVGVNFGSARYSSPDHWNRLALATDNPRDRPPKTALPGNNDNLAL